MQENYLNKKIKKVRNDDSSNVLLNEDFADEKHTIINASGSHNYYSVYVNEVIL